VVKVELERITVYDLAGGEAPFLAVAAAFYRRIDKEPALRDMFPADLSGPIERLALFLIQYFGGPGAYSEQRGHPRLRMRHLPFRIDRKARDIWVGHMLAAVDEVEVPEPARTAMREYFERGATFMINVDDGIGSES
jgi:hemoglobin